MLRRAGPRQAATVLHYGLIVLTAWAAAEVVVRVASFDIDPDAPPAAPAGDATAKVERTRRGPDDAVILRRNLFGATDIDVASEEAPVAAGIDLKLRGIAHSDGRAWAVFENTGSGEQNVFAVGDKVFEGPRLVSVDADGAEVLLRGRKKRYEIEEEGGNGEPAPRGFRSAEGKAADKERGRGGKDAAGSGVRKTGEGAWLVDRREIEHAVANLNEVITQARAVPVMSDGKSAGFKLFNIRKGSIFDKIGLHDGDVVQRVNDTELTDPSKAVGLLEEIQSMGEIKVNLVRSGKLRTNTYTIR